MVIVVDFVLLFPKKAGSYRLWSSFPFLASHHPIKNVGASTEKFGAGLNFHGYEVSAFGFMIGATPSVCIGGKRLLS